MMLDFPKECIVDKFIPKKAFYEKVNISNSIKDEFAKKLSKIYWRYKLSEDTIRVPKTENVEEIEVFELELREKYNSKNIIKVITKNIPYPILFYIKYQDEFQYAIKYNEDIFFSEWNNLVTYCFNALNLDIIYENIVRAITNIDASVVSLNNEIKRQKQINKLNAEMRKLENRMKAEKQFNIKVQYNEQIMKLRKEIEELNSDE